MSEERRQDYISLKELFEGKITNENNIAHMKEAVEDIKVAAQDTNASFKEFLRMYSDDKADAKIVKQKVNWILSGLAACATGFIGMLVLFKTKIIALLTIL